MGIMEKKMETTIVYWGYIGVVFNNWGFGSRLRVKGLLGLPRVPYCTATRQIQGWGLSHCCYTAVLWVQECCAWRSVGFM